MTTEIILGAIISIVVVLFTIGVLAMFISLSVPWYVYLITLPVYGFPIFWLFLVGLSD